MTIVRAPGSSANLGPGFDVLGTAIACHVWASDAPIDAGIRSVVAGDVDLVGDGRRECGPDHIARIAYELAGGSGPLYFDFELAPGRGLGFSAAARAAGAVLGFLQRGVDGDEAQRLGYRIVAELEGHGDNAAPATFGGSHVIAGDVHHRLAADLPGELALWVPELDTTPTDESRAAMTDTVSRADAVFNLGRLGLLMSAIYEGDVSLLAVGTQDRLHQPERLAAAPETRAAIEGALEAGAHAAWLSGSGPTVAMIVDADLDLSGHLPGTGRVIRPGFDGDGAVAV